MTREEVLELGFELTGIMGGGPLLQIEKFEDHPVNTHCNYTYRVGNDGYHITVEPINDTKWKIGSVVLENQDESLKGRIINESDELENIIENL